MGNKQEINFKPYIGLFFTFSNSQPTVCKRIYGNTVKQKISTEEMMEIPNAFLVIEEKRNFVKFLGSNGTAFWTRKTHIKPLSLPSYEGSPVPLLEQIRAFLIYCTDTRLADFKLDTMTSMAAEILPQLDSLIKKNKVKIL